MGKPRKCTYFTRWPKRNSWREQVHPDADVIVGSIFDDKLEGKARVSVVATGLDSHPKPTKSIVDLQITRNSAVSSMAATPAANSNSVQAYNYHE